MKWKEGRKKVGKNFHNFRTRQIAKPKSDIFSVIVGKYVKKKGNRFVFGDSGKDEEFTSRVWKSV